MDNPFVSQWIAISLCGISLLAYSCSNSDNATSSFSLRLEKLRAVRFDIPLAPKPYNSGTFRDEQGKTIFYFAQTKTKKYVALCDSNGRQLQLTPLDEAVETLQEVNGVAVLNKDTFVAMSYSTDSKCNVDRTGHVSHIVVYGDKHAGHRALIDPTNVELLEDRNSILAFIAYILDSPNIPEAEFKKMFADEIKSAPIVRINNLRSDSPSFTYFLKGIQTRYQPYPAVPDNFAIATFATDGKHIFYNSGYRDSLYKYDLISNQIVAAKKLVSPSIQLGIRRPKNIYDSAPLSEAFPIGAVCPAMTYDPYRGYLYMPFYHEVAADVPPNEQWEHRAWSLLVYDTSLHKLAEIPFGKEQFIPKTIFCSPEGIWIRIYSEDPRDTRYQLFKFVCDDQATVHTDSSASDGGLPHTIQ